MVRKLETREDGQLTYIRQFDGVHDMIDIANRRLADGHDDLGNASLSGDRSFTGTYSLDEAVDLATNGWPEGIERTMQIADSIEIDPEILKSSLKINAYFDMAGDEPDIDRYLQGDPSNMVNYITDPQTHGRVLDFVLNVGQHAYVDKGQIENRGAAIMAAVEALKAHGYSIGVFVIEQCTPSSYGYGGGPDVMRYEIPVLEPGQSLNADTLAFTIMHPSFLRRLLFAANESEGNKIRRQFGYRSGGGYGVPMSTRNYKHARPAYVIDKDDGLTNGHKATVAYAQKLVAASLKVLRPDGVEG